MKANLTWAAIMFNIQDLGFDRIKVAYSGGGDSGDIDEIIDSSEAFKQTEVHINTNIALMQVFVMHK